MSEKQLNTVEIEFTSKGADELHKQFKQLTKDINKTTKALKKMNHELKEVTRSCGCKYKTN